MERKELFRFVQKSVENVPLLLIGSGSSAPHGLPGMTELGAHLLNRLSTKYAGVPSWNVFHSNIENGQDLETALTSL